MPPDAAAPTPPWDQVRALFDAALALPAIERRAHVEAAAASDAVRREVLSLLEHADTAGDADAAWPPAVAAAAVGPGQRLGAWQLRERLGRGGMGEVWWAERADGAFQGEAAVKVLRPGLDSASLLARFAQEQRVLARLNHPHIARLYDAGLTGDGRPYFVMELVAGRSIDRAALDLPLEQRLTLFLQLAEAVAYAHRNLLVHRDLKPGNVLVTDSGGVKLLDFGIAKALDPLEDDGALTRTGERPFTPHFASPEQVRGEPVSTATDVYSLGVLLYLMLTGTRPTGRQATSTLEVARSVLDETPTRPSRLDAAAASDPHWSRTRRRLEGDLDNVLLKALEKQPERRYASVDAMAADVRAFLDGFPVSARAASPAYLALRFFQRNRWAVLAAGLGGLGLVTGLAAAVVQGGAAVAVGAVGMGTGLALALAQARSAATARDAAQARFEDVRQLAHAVLFDYHDLVEPLAGATPVRQRLVSDAIIYLDRLSRAAPADRRVLLEMGMAYRTVGFVQRNGFRRPHLGDTAGAMRSYDRAIEILGRLVRQDDGDEASAYQLAMALSARAGLVGEDQQLDAARRDLGTAAALFSRHLAKDTPDLRNRLELARTHLRLADILKQQPTLDDTQRLVDEARRTLESLAALQPDHKELPHVWVWVHNLEVFMGRARGDWSGVVAAEERIWSILMTLHLQDPHNVRFLEDLAGSARWRMTALGRLRQPELVAQWAKEAVERARHIARADPDDRTARRAFLTTAALAGWSFVEAGDAAQGQALYDTLAPEIDALALRHRSHFDTRRQHASFSLARALAHAAAGGTSGAAWSEAGKAAEALQSDFAATDTPGLVPLPIALSALEAGLALRTPGADASSEAWMAQAREALRRLGVG